MGRFCTVVKARPNDVRRDVFRAMKERLGLARLFIGIETDAHQGLATLTRGVDRKQNQAAMEILDELGLYACFNMLIFDPDTTYESLEDNLAFMQRWGSYPLNFGRVELYAGTPLLERMQREGRCRGDYMGWDYSLLEPVQQVFDLAMKVFRPRNFDRGALANRLMGTRFDVEVAAHFHPDTFREHWRAEAKRISRTLAESSVRGLRQIMGHVSDGARESEPFIHELAERLRREEKILLARATALEEQIQTTVGARCAHSRALAAAQSSHTEVPHEH